MDWERDFESLLEELDKLELESTCTDDAGELPPLAVPLKELQQTMTAENRDLMMQQERIVSDLAELKRLVMEQTEKFSNLLNTN
jgi:hypothetical protein